MNQKIPPAASSPSNQPAPQKTPRPTGVTPLSLVIFALLDVKPPRTNQQAGK